VRVDGGVSLNGIESVQEVVWGIGPPRAKGLGSLQLANGWLGPEVAVPRLASPRPARRMRRTGV
jgi:hypothetical protein